MGQAQVSVFGGLTAGEAASPIRQPQPLALLAYLALEGPKPRDHLAMVFWPHAKSPLNNLSSALTRIRSAHPDWLQLDAHSVATTVRTDADEILQHLAAEAYESALDAYAGPFFHGVKFRSLGIELEEWIFGQRESFASAVSLSATELARRAEAKGDRPAAISYAEQAVEIAGHGLPDPEVLRRSHQILSNSTSPTRATLQRLAESLDVDLDVRSDAATQPGRVGLPDEVVDNLAMLGRSREMALLEAAIIENRLVTILGMGGSGKSTIARAFQQKIHQGEQRVWVSLASEQEAPEAAARSIARSLEMPFTSSDDLFASLNEQSDETKLVLVLDGVEHLGNLDDFLDRLLKATSHVSVVVTSRRRLHTAQGATVELRGLSTDGPDGAGDAYDLLRRHAQRSAPGFPRDQAEEHAAQRLCRSLHGLPLAIEISAAMLDLVPIDSLVDDAELGAQLLEQAGDMSESLASMLKRSLVLLEPGDLQSLRELSVFPDSFDLQAARAIASADVKTMRHLVDHSLVTVVHAGQFVLHPVVTRYLRADNQQPAARFAVEKRHAEHYANLLNQSENSASGESRKSWSGEEHGGLANIVEAWRWSVRNEQWQILELAAPPLHSFLQRTHQLHLADELFDRALTTLTAQQHAPPVTAEIANNHAWVAWRRGDIATAKRHVQLAMKTVDPSAVDLAIRIHRTEATIAMAEGHLARAQEIHEYAATLLSEQSDPRLALLVQEGLGECARQRGDYEAARGAFRTAIDVGRRLKDDHIIARSHLMLGYVERQSAPKRALVLLGEGFELAKKNDFVQLLAMFPSELGYAYLENDMHAEAIASFEEGLRLNEGRDEAWLDSYNQTGLASVFIAQGLVEKASAMLERSLRSARGSGDWAAVIEALLESCSLATKEGRATQVVGLLESVLDHPASEYTHRQRAKQILDGLDGADRDHGADGPRQLTTSTRLDEAAEAAIELLHFG